MIYEAKSIAGNRSGNTSRQILALLIPLAAFFLQWIFWSSIQPYVWFLFYPAVFFSAWLGGKRAGLAATALSTIVVWWFFIPTRYSFSLESPTSSITIVMFACMGVLFSVTHERLRKAHQQAVEAMTELTDAKASLEERVNERTADLVKLTDSLRESEKRFRSVMEHIPNIAVQGYALDGTVLYWNRAAEEMYGYSSEEALGANLLDLIIPPEMKETVIKDVKQMVETNKPIPSDELLLMRKDGSRIPVLSSHSLINSVGGQPELFCLDINLTERKQMEESLRESELRFRSIFEQSLDSIFNTTPDGIIFNANPAACRMFGMTVQELCAAGRAGIMNTSDPRFAPALEERKRTGRLNTELTCIRKNGEIFPAEVSSVITPGELPSSFVIVRDITERKRAEEELRKSAMHLRAIIETLPVPLVVNDELGNVTFLNKEFVQTIGYTTNDIPTVEDWWPLAYPDPQYRQQVLSQWLYNLEEAKRSNSPFTPMEISIRCKDGEFRTFICSAAFLTENNVGTHLVFLYDITDRKQAEAEKLVLEQQYNQAQKLESLGVLAGGIAHDFNNILAIIIGHCSLVKMQYDTADQHIPQIEKAAERAAELCRQMLAYAGKANFVQSEVNVGELVNEMVKMLKSTIGKNIVINLNLSADIPFIRADASQISQIVMNMIINASEAIGAAQGVISVSLAKTIVKAGESIKDHNGKTISAGSYVCLEVADNGCGMESETSRRIFEPFYTTKFTGRGLGMSAVLGIIAAHGGALQLISQPNEGTTFKVYLPIPIKDSVEKGAVLQDPAKPWMGSGTILLVEDEEQVLLIAKTMFQKLGFTVIEASNGKEALELYRSNSKIINLVVTDMGLPVMDGYQLFHELKTLCPELPIIISSGFGDTVVTSRISREDIAGLVSKPYNFDQMRAVLKNIAE